MQGYRYSPRASETTRPLPPDVRMRRFGYHDLTHTRNRIVDSRPHDLPVMLATRVCNEEVPEKNLVATVREINDITRSLADEAHGVYLVDAAAKIEGSYELMSDICHFRIDRDGEEMLVQTLAESVTALLDDWTDHRKPEIARLESVRNSSPM